MLQSILQKNKAYGSHITPKLMSLGRPWRVVNQKILVAKDILLLGLTKDANTKLRLDRAVATKGWIEKFQVMSNVVHLLPHASNHLPIAIQVQKLRQKHRRVERGFKFEECWLLWDDCETRVQQAWSLAGSGASVLADVHAKIRACGDELKAWGDTRTLPEEEEIKSLQNRLDRINRDVTTDESKVEYLAISKQLDDLLLKQEIYWAQRSRVAWLKHGDRNTKIFHPKASQRQ